jgi:hypothetical protein
MPHAPMGKSTVTDLAILLGPYRNLSTITAATLALHPDVQVLNHAGERFLGVPDLDFIGNPSAATYDAFLRAAREASAGGKRGSYGGSILYSHAFDDPEVRGVYCRRYGTAMVKPETRCLIWKESMRVQRELQRSDDRFARLCTSIPTVKFILPIRHPLDCALSNLRTGHIRHLGLDAKATLADALGAVLDALAWSLARRDEWPDRVLAFDEAEIGVPLFARMAAFLDIHAEPQWISDAESAFRVRNRQRNEQHVRLYRQTVAHKLAAWPDLLSRIV